MHGCSIICTMISWRDALPHAKRRACKLPKLVAHSTNHPRDNYLASGNPAAEAVRYDFISITPLRNFFKCSWDWEFPGMHESRLPFKYKSVLEAEADAEKNILFINFAAHLDPSLNPRVIFNCAPRIQATWFSESNLNPRTRDCVRNGRFVLDISDNFKNTLRVRKKKPAGSRHNHESLLCFQSWELPQSIFLDFHNNCQMVPKERALSLPKLLYARVEFRLQRRLDLRSKDGKVGSTDSTESKVLKPGEAILARSGTSGLTLSPFIVVLQPRG
ncbi:uncharacterized protein BDR25DRAFT_361157 [Lindgomyces ingoldianus]|uniref:Uncharacterized protein n=1 Tax=Lindgomyces ingoldianus TaxID=673940 RepID=A0ACB6QEK6_9PLEO|nr:uncharacterized protein BDR25DRAFT_361157 [Lindgomyces ingoldianus]KAF2464935.1 hypothetical protein BDR25DRAFT_361157 [Lindgomyces ingoldianus]